MIFRRKADLQQLQILLEGSPLPEPRPIHQRECPSDLLHLNNTVMSSLDLKTLGQMPYEERTIRDRIYSDYLKKSGPLTNTELGKMAAENPHFSKVTADALEKDIDRFVKHYEHLGIIARIKGKIEWSPQTAGSQGQAVRETTVELSDPSSPDSRHEEVQRLIRGMANGTITIRDKSPHKELNRVKGEILDEFMADIDLYNTHGHELFISNILEARIFNTALKLRAYGFIEEKKEQPQQAHESKE